MIELKFLKEMMLISQTNKKNWIFVTIGIFQIKDSGFKRMSAVCLYVLMMSRNLSHITILDIHGADYRCIIDKSKAINLMQKINLTEKSRTLYNKTILSHLK